MEIGRFFNTAGPCKPEDHYMLPAATRLPDVPRLVAQKGYFVIHAPRQTGKTTAMAALAQELTGGGRYVAVMLSVEVGAAFNDDPGTAELAILSAWRRAADTRLPADLQPPPWPEAPAGQRLNQVLSVWAEQAPRPLVLFLDEIDALQDQTLISVLRQLRDGYYDRPQHFPWSLALIGLRDVRDYKVASGGSDRLNTASPFNIKVESLTLDNFTAEEVAALYQQHTTETGQPFTPEATRRAYDLTQGQPWLVNALAYLITQKLLPDSTDPITLDHINQAKERLIQRQDTHLDSLAERLRENRVRQIIEPMLAGQALGDVPADDLRFVLDLGLCRMDPLKGLVIANPIYQEVLPRVLANTPLASLPYLQPIWLKPDGRLDVDQLLTAFLAFWRQHGQPLLKSAPYHEIAPHLVLMAFLHRVANAGGTLEREYAIGSGRMDLCLRYGSETVVGEDEVGNFVLRYLQNEGVDTTYIPLKPNTRTGLAMVGVQPPDRFPLVFYRDNPADIYLTIDDVRALPLAHSRAVLLSGTALSRGSCRDATLFAAEQAKARGVTNFFDLDLRPDQWPDPYAFGLNIRGVLPQLDVVIGAEEEFFALLAEDPTPVMQGQSVTEAQLKELETLIQALLAASPGPATLALKRGPRGVSIFTKNSDVIHAAGFPVEVLNTVGAGDAFASGLIYGYLKGWDWYQCGRMGNACGALVVTRHGCAAALPSEQEALDFITERGGF